MTKMTISAKRNRPRRANGLGRSRLPIVLCLAVFVFASAFLAAADESPNKTPAENVASTSGPLNGKASVLEEILRFRYWMVPADRIDEWPWGPEKYYPIPSADFEKWINDFSRKELSASDASGAVSLGRLKLSARLENGALVDGRAWATFESVDPLAGPFLFDPCSFSVSDFLWDDGQAASVGLYPDGLIYLAHPKKGTLTFRWSQSGTKDAAGCDRFDLSFVTSPATDLELDVPENLRPRISAGEIRELSAMPENGSKRWLVCPGAHHRVLLSFVPAAQAAQIQEKVGYRQDLACRMAEEGIDLTSSFIFDRGDHFSGELTVILDQPLLPTSVEWKNPKQEAEIVSRVSSFGTTKLQIRLPEGETAPELQISAFCPNQPGNHRRLPGIRLLSEQLFWKETVLRLTVARPLVATGFETFESVRTFDRFASRLTGQETFTFKYFEPNAGLAVLLSESKPAITFDSAHEISFDPQEIRVRSELTLRSDAGGAMKFSLDLTPDWEIETVKDLDGGTLNWTTARGESANRLDVSLRRPIPTDSTLRLELSGRYLGEIQERMAVDSLIPLDLSRRFDSRHWAAFVAAGQYQIRPVDAVGRPVTLAETDESATREIFSKTPVVSVVSLGNESSGLYVRLDKAAPAYSGALSGRVTVRSETLTEEWSVLCTPPAAGRIERVLLAFYDSGGPLPDETEWNWSIAGETERMFQVTRLSEEERRFLGLSVRSRVWEIRPVASRSVGFEIRAARTRPIRSEERIPLACLPETDHQSAEVVIASENPIPPTITTRSVHDRLTPLPVSGEYETTLGGFSYDPLELRSRSETPEIALTERHGEGVSAMTNAWCWFLRVDSQFEPSGTVRNYLTAFIENAGRPELNITLPDSLGIEAVHAVWADGERLTWYPLSRRNKTALRVVLPAKRRFVTVSLEYHYTRSTLAVRQHLTPRIPELDIKTLSGDWNAWFPPEYAAGPAKSESIRFRPFWGDFKRVSDNADAEEDQTLWRRLENLWPFGHQTRFEEYKQFTADFLERLGDPAVLSSLLDQKRLAGSSAESAAAVPAQTTAAGDSAALTWGDLFARPESLAMLFPEITAERSARVFVNRSAMSRGRILPSDLIQLPDAATPAARALGLMERAGMVILFLRPDLIYVTSAQERQEFGDDVVPLGNDRFWYVRDPVRLRSILRSLDPGVSPHVVSAEDWNDGALGIANPWQIDLYSAGFPLITPGWNRCCVSLDEATDGVIVLNRYRLAARKWFFFLLVIALTWRGPLCRPTFLVGLLGFSLALIGFVPPTGVSTLYGVTLGTICSFGFLLLREKKTPEPKEPPAVEESEPGFVLLNRIPTDRISDDSEHKHFIDSGTPQAEDFSAPLVGERAKKPHGPKEGSTAVFSIFHNISAEEKEKLIEEITDEYRFEDRPASTASANPAGERQTENAEPKQASDTDNTPDDGSDAPPIGDDKQSGRCRISLLIAASLALTAILVFYSLAAPRSSGAEPLSEPSTGLANAEPAANQTAANQTAANQTAANQTAENQEAEEPARVFFPYGDDLKPLKNDYVWVPESLHRKLSALIASQENLENPWRLSAASYEGTVSYNAFTQTLSLFHLKATYTVVLETQRAMIRLPMMALPPDGGAKFDRQPIYPIFHQDELLFDVTGSTPGEHTLELTLTPPLFETGSEEGVHIDIPRVPDAKLELRLPPDAPPIRVNGARGSVRLGGDLLSVRLGPTDRIVLEREEEPGKIGSAQVEVEQLFQLRALSSQTSLSARFRFRISGGKVQTLYFQNDPRYFLAQCSCDEVQLSPTIQRESLQSDQIRVTFKKPVSGIVTLRAEYVVRDFSGIGQIRLPRIRAARARITRSWLALFETPMVEFVRLFPSDVAVGTFQNLWEGDETPLAVYDLMQPDPAWTASIRLKSPRQSVRETLTYFCNAASTSVDYSADYQTDGEVFRLSLRVPETFRCDEVALTDSGGEAIEKPEVFSDSGRLYLFFQRPLTGNCRIHLTGRLKTEIDREVAFEPLAMEDVPSEPISFDVFRDESVQVRLKNVSDFTDDSPVKAREETHGRKALFVGGGKIAQVAEFDPVRLLIERNVPKIGGQVRTVLFNRAGDRWEILSDYFLNVEEGIVDRFEIELDESCVGPVTVEPNVSFRVQPRGKEQTLTILPAKPVEGAFAFRIRTPIQYGSDTLRLPRVALTFPSTDAGSGLKTRFFLPAVDALRQTRYVWTVENMRFCDPAAGADFTENEMNQGRLSPAVSALAAAAPVAETPFRAPEDFPAVVTQLSGLAPEDFLIYEATAPDCHAVFSAGRSDAQTFGAETNFFIRRDGSVYGETVMDVRLGGASECELHLAKRAILLSVTIDGIPTPAEQETSGVWRLSTSSQAVGRRFAVLFCVPAEENFRKKSVSERGNYTRFELVPATLAGIAPLRSYWTAVFEADDTTDESAAPCFVNQINVGGPQEPASPAVIPPSDPEVYHNGTSPWKIPVDYAEALPVLTRFSMEKMKHLLDLLELTISDTAADDPDTHLWFGRWFVRWQKCRNEVRTQFASQKTPLPFGARQKAAIYQCFSDEIPLGDPLLNRSELMADEAFKKSILLREATEQDYLELMERYDRIIAESQLGPVAEKLAADETAAPSTLSLWQLNHRSTPSRFLIGLTNADISKITIDRFNVTRHFLFRRGMISFFWLMSAALLIWALRSFEFRSVLRRNLDLIVLGIGALLIVLRPGFIGWTLILSMLIVRLIRMRYRPKKPFPDASRSPSGDIVVMSESGDTGDVSFHPPAK